MKRFVLISAMIFSAAVFFTPCVFADYIQFTNLGYEAGTGFGNVENVLSIQHTPSETGGIAPPSNTQTGDATNTSRTWTSGQLTALGYSPSKFAVVFNINEPGSAPQVNLLSFQLNFYTPENALYGSAATNNVPQNGLTPIGGNGTGTAGYLMMYHQEGANLLNWFFADPNRIVGGTGSVSLSASGAENFYLAPAPVPIPAAAWLLGSGLLGLVALRRRFKK